jgi:hypothetical protein
MIIDIVINVMLIFLTVFAKKVNFCHTPQQQLYLKKNILNIENIHKSNNVTQDQLNKDIISRKQGTL